MSKVKPQEALQIDEHRLELEWQAQPKLYYDYAAKLADARRDVDLAKNQLEAIKAETARDIRREPDRFGLAKVTEASIAEWIPVQEEVKDAQEALIKAKHAVDMLTAMVAALDHRRRALEKLVDLWLANYFASPRASTGSREGMAEAEKRSARRKGTRKREE